MAELGLNDHHETVVRSYMKFARYLRTQVLKQIEHTFNDVSDSKLMDSTFTLDEVKDVITNLEDLIKLDVEADFINFSHNNVLMLKQLFSQAEKWHLRLQIDLSELQNQELLQLIQAIENEEMGSNATLKNTKLTPIELEEGPTTLLRMEIDRLKQDNEKLVNMLQDIEDRADLYKEEKNTLNEKLTNAKKEIKDYKLLLEQNTTAKTTGGEEIHQKLNQVENLLNVKTDDSQGKQEKLKMELHSTREKVKQVESQLQLAELELERKFSETKAYANMKLILLKKNALIKSLRSSLQNYEPNVQQESDEE